uniref:DNL-type zinc finger protein n=1 Tax=Lygus hesperus TaxID=30085 RepID=A0A0A9ZIJ5_LYGHE
MSNRSYTEGVVILRCDGCKSLHLLADHLGWFGDQRCTIEDIMHEKNESVLHLHSEDGIETLTPETVDALKDTMSKARKEDLEAPAIGTHNYRRIKDHDDKDSSAKDDVK